MNWHFFIQTGLVFYFIQRQGDGGIRSFELDIAGTFFGRGVAEKGLVESLSVARVAHRESDVDTCLAWKLDRGLRI